MDNNFSNDRFADLGIYELRNIARKCGVKSPTTKKRQQLIDSIIAISNGTEKVYLSNMGRPPKDFKVSNNFVFKEKSFAEPKFNVSYIKQGQLYYKGQFHDSETPDKNLIFVSGILSRNSEGIYYFWNFNFTNYCGPVYVDIEHIREFHCFEGCSMEGYAYFLYKEVVAFMYDVTKVNGDDRLYQTYCKEDIKELLYPEELLGYGGLIEGKKTIIDFENKQLAYDFYDNITKNIAPKFYPIFINLNCGTDKALYFEKNIKGLKVLSASKEPSEYHYHILNELIEHINTAYMQNRKVILFISDLSWLLKVLYDYSEKFPNSINPEQKIEELLDIAKINSDNGSISVIGANVKNDNFKDDIAKLKYFCE